MENKRLEIVREHLRYLKADAVVIPTSDPNQNEYVADRYQLRRHLSGFTGSAGTLVVAHDWAGLWTDGRYELQAKHELQGTGIDLYCTALEGTLSIEKKLSELPEDAKVVVDGSRMSHAEFERISKGIAPRTLSAELISENLWMYGDSLPNEIITVVPDENAGATRAEKLTDLRKRLRDAGAEATMIGASEDICWLLNLRGNDVPHTPIFYAFLWVDQKYCTLFLEREKRNSPSLFSLYDDNINVFDFHYDAYVMPTKKERTTVLLDPNRINEKMASMMEKHHDVIYERNPSTDAKAVKNATEIANLREAYRRDGIALTKFFHWIENEGVGKTEYEIAEKLEGFRAEGDGFLELSFSTIAGYGPNGAIIHYKPERETSAVLENESLLLVDSGGQYDVGTTDITRTIAMGELSEQERRDYTLTLRSHIALATALFPKGATGTILDGFARYPMWQQMIDYRHGTGHGVGYRLSVHEGPMSISRATNTVPLEPGMVVSIEPGIYREGSHGVRIENIVVVETAGANDFGEFRQFSVLSDCYIDTAPLELSLLSSQEKEWLNSYNKRVYENLADGLDEETRAFLHRKTRSVY